MSPFRWILNLWNILIGRILSKPKVSKTRHEHEFTAPKHNHKPRWRKATKAPWNRALKKIKCMITRASRKRNRKAG